MAFTVSSRDRAVIVAASAALFVLASSEQSIAKVKAVSTDGEATVYLSKDFSGDFDLKYGVTLEPAPSNHAWTGVSLLLLDKQWPGSSVSVGLSRGYPNAATLAGFTTSSRPRTQSKYKSFPLHCESACVVELRGDTRNVYASLNYRRIATWSRQTFPMIRPYIQINAEVSAVGDRIAARLRPIRIVLAEKSVPLPTCAFTTQGIEPKALGDSMIVFSGTRRVSSRATYISLLDGRAKDSCPATMSRNL